MIDAKVIIITGASSGIGEATAKLLAAQGAILMLAARREERLKKLVQEIEASGGRASYHVTDVTNRQALHDLVDATMQKYDRLDILINNAAHFLLSLDL